MQRIIVCLVLVLVATGCGGGSKERATVARAAEGGDGPAGGASGATVVVDVAGHVRTPGVYRLAANARVHEAIEAAGGVRAGADTSVINRASTVVDGQQIVVGVRGASAGGAAAGEPAPGSKVALNSADVAALDALPGIGPVTAQRIVDDRTANGPFTGVDDLDRVSGIGPATIESLRDVVTA